jgi:hypothetical protein
VMLASTQETLLIKKVNSILSQRQSLVCELQSTLQTACNQNFTVLCWIPLS